jgi:hypothetical protein
VQFGEKETGGYSTVHTAEFFREKLGWSLATSGKVGMLSSRAQERRSRSRPPMRHVISPRRLDGRFRNRDGGELATTNDGLCHASSELRLLSSGPATGTKEHEHSRLN